MKSRSCWFDLNVLKLLFKQLLEAWGCVLFKQELQIWGYDSQNMMEVWVSVIQVS